MTWFTGNTGTPEGAAAAAAAPGAVPTPLSPEEVDAKLDKFVGTSPLSTYLIDGKKNTSTSVICRKNENGGQTCLNLSIDGITLFKTMQGKNYFCSLPAEIDETHFECRKIT